MTDGDDNLFGSYMKKLGIDLSSLVSSLWEFMLAMVSTTLLLPAQNTLLLVTTAFLLRPHEQMSYGQPPSSLRILYDTIVTEVGTCFFFS